MGIGRDHLGAGSWGAWRRAIGVVVIYAVVLQGILLGFAGVAASVSGDDGYPTFELCLNSHQDGPLSPADLPGHHGDTHCVFCFAGTHYAPAPLLACLQRFNPEIEGVVWPLRDWRLSDLREHSNAQPRGPPLGA